MIICGLLSVLSYILLIGLMFTEKFWLLMIGIFSFCFFSIPLIPISMDFACEITFPVCEAFSSGLIYAGG